MVMKETNPINQYFEKAIRRENSVPESYVAKVADRACQNMHRYYALLRSTKVEGIEELISVIHGSTFTTCHSHSHHHYTTGTLEHCLGVYDEMVKLAEGKDVAEKDIILVALLHDVGKGCSKALSAFRHCGHHPERSMRIARHYLKGVSNEVFDAIRYHQHRPIDPKLVLQSLVHEADHKDAAKCNDRVAYFRDL